MKKQAIRLFCAVFAVWICTLSVLAAPQMLVPGGSTVGMRLYTEGVVVTGFEENAPAQEAGLKKGDRITQLDGRQIKTANMLKENLTPGSVVLTVVRNGKEAEFCIRTKSGKLGAYVRDSVAGIGTVTYYDPATGTFGALGHGVNDADTGSLIAIDRGDVIRSSVSRVVRGKQGTPGELKGEFDIRDIFGTVEKNCACGIFGTLKEPISAKPLPVAQPEEVRQGRAVILSNVFGTKVKEYDVEIVKIFPHADTTGRNLLLKVTDSELLAATGGIVQGMSGSPIIQDGKLIGAVTHVLVNDPTRGYGIFMENMLDAAA